MSQYLLWIVTVALKKRSRTKVSKFNCTLESIAVVYWRVYPSRKKDFWRISLRAKSTADITPDVLNSEEKDVRSRNDKFWEQLTGTVRNNKAATNSEDIMIQR